MKFIESVQFDFIEILSFYERPFRAKFIPSKIWLDLDEYENDPIGLSNYLKKWRTRIEWRNKPSKNKMYDEFVALGGEYDPDLRQCTLHIYHPQFDKHKFTVRSWAKFKYRLMQTMMHELIHFRQFDRRGDQWSNYVVPYKRVGVQKIDSERKYLSEFDEIQAYAHCVYLDLKTRRPNMDVDFMINNCKKRRDSSTLHYFLKTFNYDFNNNHATQKIVQQIGKWDRKYSSKLYSEQKKKRSSS